MLTGHRHNGIKTGYWSPMNKDDLIQKLGPIEAKGSNLIFAACAAHCHAQVNAAECAKCPLMALEKLIVDDGGESR